MCPILHELRGDGVCQDGIQVKGASRPVSELIDGAPRRGGAIGAITPIKPTKVTFFTMILQFGKTLDCQIFLKSPPINLRTGSTLAPRLAARVREVNGIDRFLPPLLFLLFYPKI